LSGQTALTVVQSFNLENGGVKTHELPLFRDGNDATQSTNWLFKSSFDSTGGVEGHLKHTTGGRDVQSSTLTLNDGLTHLVIYRFGPAGANLTLDGTEEDTEAWNLTIDTVTTIFNLGGTTSSTQAGLSWKSDCFALWLSYLSDGEIVDLWTLFNAEKL
jgi:hypothetical protein